MLKSDTILSHRWAGFELKSPSAYATQSIDKVSDSGMKMLAEISGLNSTQLLLGSGLLDALVSAFSNEKQFVMLAEPVCHDLLEAVISTGGRYVDAGRNHLFQVDLAGWQSILNDSRASLAYLAQPEEPTGTLAPDDCIAMAQEANIPLLSDRRFGPPELPPAVVPGVIHLSLLHPATADQAALECLSGPVELIARVQQGMDEKSTPAWNSAIHNGMKASHLEFDRFQQQLHTALTAIDGVHVLRPQAHSIWVRIPGQLSQVIADRAQHPGIVGSSAWTWRDAVWLAPQSSMQGMSLLDSLKRAL